MNIVENQSSIRREQGFDVFVLSNQDVELAVVPELGARIISLKDLRTKREWLWHPTCQRNLFRNRAGDRFESSPLVGLDECLPTIAPCFWGQRDLPDHGEVWAAGWTVDREAWERGLLRTSVGLKISPFDFARTIELNENEVRLRYHLRNRATAAEDYLWAMHPLLRLQSGDKLELPLSTRALLNGADWLDALNSSSKTGDCEKTFASPISDGWAAIRNRESGDRLHFEWDAADNNTLGLWLNRGGWHGHHHFAIEPANGESDILTVAAQRKCCGRIAAGGVATWQVCIRVGN